MALSTDRDVNFYPSDNLLDFPVDASARIYKGAFVGRNRATGYARPLTPGDDFLGIAYREADNSAVSNPAGGASVRLHREIDIVHALASASLADVGKDVYASADDTLTLTPTNNSRIGRIVGLEAAGVVRVRIQPAGTNFTVGESMPFATLADANATLTLDHVGRTLAMGNTAARTLTLPAVAQVRAGGWMRFIKTSAAAVAITLDGNASETIDGAATFAALDALYDTVLLVCTGSEWVILSRDVA